ncbi:hypothetical protein [Mycoplasma procyoni]|uniref:hypothetical protein n=1 Tax=Mycoplasma procyoni TaxID=568784 RepID=UPI00197C8641|nr:hypothetical protein [Mycoplasma procyoni]MBN3534527.1 hypothetical protein [Mycoplasma procyoni]
MKKIKLKITTPKGVFLEEEVENITLKTTEGYRGIQYGMQPFISSLVPAKMFINSQFSPERKEAYIASGIVYVEKELANIISDQVSYDPKVLEEYSLAQQTSKHEISQEAKTEIQLKKEIEKSKK